MTGTPGCQTKTSSDPHHLGTAMKRMLSREVLINPTDHRAGSTLQGKKSGANLIVCKKAGLKRSDKPREITEEKQGGGRAKCQGST